MTLLSPPANRPAKKTRALRVRPPHPQHGVVLIIALIILVVISLLAVTSMRNVGSTESVAGNVRTTELATQAAEIALRHCESSVVKISRIAGGDTTSPEATYATTFVDTNILTASTGTTAQWQSLATWDSTATATFVLPLDLVNQTGMTITTYKRPPECMVESLPVVLTGSAALSTTASFVVTARGFGPEVAAADGARARPQGTEVWLQSTIGF